MLDAVATATTYGMGGRRRRCVRCTTKGVMTRQTISLTRKADIRPDVRINVCNRCCGCSRSNPANGARLAGRTCGCANSGIYEMGEGIPAVPRIPLAVVSTRAISERDGRGLPVADLHHVPPFTEVRVPRDDFPCADWHLQLAKRRLADGLA